MSTRTKLVGAASAALISAAMMMAPAGSAAAAPPPPPDHPSSATPDPDGPFATGRSDIEELRNPFAKTTARSAASEPVIYEPETESGFQPCSSPSTRQA